MIAQRPNISLIAWALATAVGWFLHGTARTVVSGIGTIALVIWAADEIARGVNPWRRMLGVVVLVAVVIAWFG